MSDKVQVTIYWMESRRNEWNQEMTPEQAEGMEEQLSRDDDWLIWKTAYRQCINPGTAKYTHERKYKMTERTHKVRAAEVLGITVINRVDAP